MTDKENNFLDIDFFSRRHIGPNRSETASMLEMVGYDNLDDFITTVVPKDILFKSRLSIGPEKTEQEALIELKKIASKNESYRSYIGQGESWMVHILYSLSA